MKKWVFITLLGLIGVIGILVNVYLNAVEPVNKAEEQAFAIAAKEASLVTVTDFQLYNGDETYYVISGLNKSGEEIVAWIPEEEGKVIVRKAKDGVTNNQAIEKLTETENPEEIVSVRLGIVKNRPAWEIYYHSQGKRINYFYVDFETGEWLRKIENL